MLKWVGRLFAALGFLVFFSVLLLVFVFSKGGMHTSIKPNSVLHITLDGRLYENEPAFSIQNFLEEKSPSLRSLVEMIEKAKSDPNIIGILTEIKQPKMGVAQTQELRNALIDFKKSGKFTYAYTDTFGEFEPAMSYYYLATAHKNIWLQPLGHLCITGIYYEAPFARKLLEEWQVNPQIGRRAEYKNALDYLTEFNMTPAHEESTHKVLQSLFDQMVQDISVDRGVTPDSLNRIIDSAPIFDSIQSKELTLVDHVGYFYELENFIKKNHGVDAKLVPTNHYEASLRNPPASENSIALIFASGQIVREEMAFNPLTEDMYITPKSMETAFKEALNDPTTRAIVLRVNSPGGSPVASESIAAQMKKAQSRGIPVIVSMGDVAGSGGYWISCYANKIVAHPATITGSIGVIGGKIATEKLWNRFGIFFEGIKIGQTSNMWSGVKPYDQEGWKKLQSWLDYIYDTFLAHVAKGRNLSLDHVKEIAKGRIWSGEDARKFGLVDELGGLNKAISLAKAEAKLSLAEPINVKQYPHAKNIFEQLLTFTSKESSAMTIILSKISRFIGVFNAPALKMPMDPENIR